MFIKFFTLISLCLSALAANANEKTTAQHQLSLGLGTLYGNANLDIGGVIGGRYEYIKANGFAPFIAIAPFGEEFSYKVGASYYFSGENLKPRFSLSYGTVESEYLPDENSNNFEDKAHTYMGTSIGTGFKYKHATFDLTYNQITDTLTAQDKNYLIEKAFVSANFGYVY